MYQGEGVGARKHFTRRRTAPVQLTTSPFPTRAPETLFEYGSGRDLEPSRFGSSQLPPDRPGDSNVFRNVPKDLFLEAVFRPLACVGCNEPGPFRKGNLGKCLSGSLLMAFPGTGNKGATSTDAHLQSNVWLNDACGTSPLSRWSLG